MSTQSSDLHRALSEVRRAFRLLHVYHRRLCDLLQTIDETLSRSGLAFQRWSPINVLWLPDGTSPFFRPDKWAWDLSPSYQVLCEWKGAHGDQVRRVVFECVADTGYNTTGGGEPDASRFDDVERCITELRVNMWTARGTDADWGAASKEVGELPDKYDGRAHAVRVGGVDLTYARYAVDAAELVDESAVHAKLCAPLEAWLKDS
jgi:hypothetical protein